MDDLEQARADLLARVAHVATANGVTMRDPHAVTNHLMAEYKLQYTHHLIEDHRLKDWLFQAKGAHAELFESPVAESSEPGPKNPDFRAFLGGLAADYDKMPPQKKLFLWGRFQEQQKNPTQRAAEKIRAELALRFGPDYETTAPAIDRARLADAEGKPRGPTLIPTTPIVIPSGLHGEKRLAAYYMTKQIADAERRL